MTASRETPDLDLSLTFTDQIGILRRWANHVSRPSEADRIMAEIDKMVRWQANLRREFCVALGLTSTAYGWGTLVNHVRNEHERAESSDSLADAMRSQLALPIGKEMNGQ
jgi:hypothetical protein